MQNETQQTQDKKQVGVGREKIVAILARLRLRYGEMIRRLAG
jgi:hypothetical protein